MFGKSEWFAQIFNTKNICTHAAVFPDIQMVMMIVEV